MEILHEDKKERGLFGGYKIYSPGDFLRFIVQKTSEAIHKLKVKVTDRV